MRRVLRGAVAVVGIAALLGPGLSATAATTPGWATWGGLQGAAGAYTTTMQLPAGGFPLAEMTTDSRGGQVGVQSGATVWLSEGTPPGEIFGSSRNRPYLNLRPSADTPASPSTTTYTFERPARPGSWAFVLGDIDADRAVVIARGADGQLLTGAELGWQGGFNYCAAAGSPSCTGDADDVATWDPVSGEVIGNAGAVDTSGASGWFMPTVPVSSLTIYFFHRLGFPVYQTWFASLARDISGTVTHSDSGPLADATLTLLDPDGSVVATTTSAADGTYGFAGFAATDGYTVEVRVPGAPPGSPGYVVDGPATRSADLSDADATDVDFVVRDIVPASVSGRVITAGGEPVPGAVVTLIDADGVERSAVSDSTGAYLIDTVPVGEHTFSVEPPQGYAVVSSPPPLDVPAGSEEPIVDQDVVVQPAPSVAGAVTAGAQPVAGALVTITGPDGARSAATGADGSYSFDLLPPGEYTVTIEVPFGYTAGGPTTRDVTVEADDLMDVDFALQRPGSVGGYVGDDDGAPVADVTVTVTGPDGPVVVTTDAAGNYLVDDLPAGEYEVVIDVPDGYGAEVTRRTVTISDAGERRLDVDFEVQVDVEPPTTDPPTADPPTVDPSTDPTSTDPAIGGPSTSASQDPAPGASGGTGGNAVADTGAEVTAGLVLAGSLLGLGLVMVALVRSRSRGSSRR
ncbi:MSCRAMM family protein [Pseudactinotalea sp.]|uniref:MSCRAMM family protein n=1 Tax=Pseudactinotalea sp. TaxID=1926260 RepID=UPI003B3A6E62